MDKYFFTKTEEGIAMLAERDRRLIEELREMRKAILESEDGQTMVREKIEESRQELANLNVIMKEIQIRLTSRPKDEQWIHEMNEERTAELIKKAQRQLRRFQMLQTGVWRAVDDRQPFDIGAIKSVPIETIMPSNAVYKSGDRWTYRCPLHNEKTGSFIWYKSKNTYHCFGCQENGDIIDLYQKINHCDFVTACRALTTS